jgi:hypothetical protein
MRASLALSGAFTNLLYPAPMASASIFARDPRSRAGAFAVANPLWLALAIVAAVTAVRALGTVGSDVSWQLWIAHQLNGGVRLYRDIVETNPPLWFWMGMPVDWLSQLIHVRSDHVLIVLIGCLAALSLTATSRILDSMDRQRRCLLLAFAALVLVGIPWLQAGQREQIALIGTLPYAALIGARRTGRAVSWELAAAIGIGAALGFALKHYFLLVPVLLELWLLAGQRRRWRPLRAETLAIAATGLVYAAAFGLFARDYLTAALPLILLAYGVTGAERFIDLLQPAVLTAAATLALLAAHPRLLRSEGSGFAAAMAVAAVGFAGAYFIQAKGWSYHAVPFAGSAAIALAASLTGGTLLPRWAALAAPALLMLPFWIAAQQAMAEPRTDADVRSALEGLQAGESVGFIGTDPALGWNVTLQDSFVYPGRYNGFWMMRAVVRNEDSDPRLATLGRTVVRQTVEDFRCRPPLRIVVARPAPEAAKAGAFDILAFFRHDPQFVQLLGHYRPIHRTSVEVYQQVSPLDAGRDCLRRAGG